MNEAKELKPIQAQELNTVPDNGGLSPLVMAAMNGQLDTEKLKQLLEIQKDYERNEAEKAFHVALAEFKTHEIKLERDKLVSFNETSYRHTTLGSALAKINPILSQYGLSLSWETKQETGGLITVSCVLSHAKGHSKSTSLSASPDASGKKNNIQAIGSTVSYLERYTAFSLLGLASVDQDDDAAGAGSDTITEEQVADLQALIDEVKADKAGFLRYMGVVSLEEIGAKHYKRGVAALEQKRKAAQG